MVCCQVFNTKPRSQLQVPGPFRTKRLQAGARLCMLHQSDCSVRRNSFTDNCVFGIHANGPHPRAHATLAHARPALAPKIG